MGKNIVICSDGTGNTFDKSVSNVTRMIKMLSLDDSQNQIVVYDQGIGTNSVRLDAVKQYRDSDSVPDERSLKILDAPKKWWFDPTGLPTRVLGLAGGYGFKANVREMYKELSDLYQSPDDKIYLFGFSRGAFTVRALAGLVFRCGLPAQKVANFEKLFDEAYKLYQPMARDVAKINAFRTNHPHVRDCEIYFLGIWDTVKSYGGVWPVILPHLRHNPHVKIVRHAMALDEKRSWFNATTWGQLDLDKKGAKQRLEKTLDDAEKNKLAEQDIEEVWFRGCHSDVGGGDVEACTAMIPLRWMLGEAQAAGLRLNESGESALSFNDPPWEFEIHESSSWFWRMAAYAQIWEINNEGEYPVLQRPMLRTGLRTPNKFTRKKKLLLHSSVGKLDSISVPFEYRQTKLKK